MDELPPAPGEPPALVLGKSASPAQRPRELALTSEELAARRRNRLKLLLIVVPALVLTGGSLVAVVRAGSTPPPVRPVSVPHGYSASTDGYFAFAFPSTWSTNDIYSDNTGDDDLSGPTGWAAEHIGVRDVAPVVGEMPPPSLEAFGMDRPTPFTLSGGTPVKVPGATALRYSMTRPGGFEATVIDAWRPAADAEIWLVVHADRDTTQAIVASLNT
jgi:hypothetical protein